MKLLWVGKFFNRSDQLRALDTAAKGRKKVDVLPAELLNKVMAEVVTIFGMRIFNREINLCDSC
jgi:hypothetical protein